jgi:hypothetical protein
MPGGIFCVKKSLFWSGKHGGKTGRKSVLVKRFHPAGGTFSADREKPPEKQFANRRNKA